MTKKIRKQRQQFHQFNTSLIRWVYFLNLHKREIRLLDSSIYFANYLACLWERPSKNEDDSNHFFHWMKFFRDFQ